MGWKMEKIMEKVGGWDGVVSSIIKSGLACQVNARCGGGGLGLVDLNN